MLSVSYTIHGAAVPNVDFYWFGLNLKSLLGSVGLLAGILNLLALAGITLFVIRSNQMQVDSENIQHNNMVTKLQSA